MNQYTENYVEIFVLHNTIGGRRVRGLAGDGWVTGAAKKDGKEEEQWSGE